MISFYFVTQSRKWRLVYSSYSHECLFCSNSALYQALLRILRAGSNKDRSGVASLPAKIEPVIIVDDLLSLAEHFSAIFSNKANFNFPEKRQIPWTKPLLRSDGFLVKSFVFNKYSAHQERFLPDPHILTAIFPHAVRSLDHSDGSYVIVGTIRYEASIRSFFLRVRKEGVW